MTAVGWEYRLADLGAGDDPETWARELAAQGWHLWPASPGRGADAVVTINGVSLRRCSLRRTSPGDTGDGRGDAMSGVPHTS